jgi:hypothetical protein
MGDFNFDVKVEVNNFDLRPGVSRLSLCHFLLLYCAAFFATVWAIANSKKNASEIERDYPPTQSRASGERDGVPPPLSPLRGCVRDAARSRGLRHLAIDCRRSAAESW